MELHFQIAETCQLAIERIQWLSSEKSTVEKLSDNPYNSVDPAPPSEETNVSKLREDLLNEELSLYARYRAMFGLRNIGDEQCVLALADGKISCNFIGPTPYNLQDVCLASIFCCSVIRDYY